MDARFLGFSVDFKSNQLTLDGFMSFLSSELSHQMEEDQITGCSRILYFNKEYNDNFYTGMVVTVRNQKKLCHGKQLNGGSFTFDILDLNRADKILEFNYFIINKKSGLGLYQHYHQSCAPNVFGRLFKKLSANYYQQSLECAITIEEKKKCEELSKSELRKVRKSYAVQFNFSILVRQEKLKEILTEYKKIKSFEYEYATLSPDVIAATPLANHVLKKKESLRFHTPTDISGLASAISSFAKNTILRSGRVKVENEFGDEFPLRIFDMPDYFAVYDFDDLADKLANIKSSEFYKSKIVDYLLETYMSDDYDHIFQVKVRNAS